MWSVGPEPLDLYIGAVGAGIARGGKCVGWDSYDDVDVAIKHWMEIAANASPSWRRPQIRVWLGGSLARPFVIGPIKGLRGAAEVDAFVQARAVEFSGLTSECVVVLDGQLDKEPVLAVAADRAFKFALESAADEAHLAIATIRPWWASAVDEAIAIRPHARLVIAEDEDAITWVESVDDRWISAGTQVPKPTSDQVKQLLSRRAMASGLTNDQVAHLVLAPRLESPGSIWPRAAIAPKLGGEGS